MQLILFQVNHLKSNYLCFSSINSHQKIKNSTFNFNTSVNCLMLENQKGSKIFLFLIITCDVSCYYDSLYLLSFISSSNYKAATHKTINTICRHYAREKPPSRGKPSQYNYSFKQYSLRLFTLDIYHTFPPHQFSLLDLQPLSSNFYQAKNSRRI